MIPIIIINEGTDDKTIAMCIDSKSLCRVCNTENDWEGAPGNGFLAPRVDHWSDKVSVIVYRLQTPSTTEINWAIFKDLRLKSSQLPVCQLWFHPMTIPWGDNAAWNTDGVFASAKVSRDVCCIALPNVQLVSILGSIISIIYRKFD